MEHQSYTTHRKWNIPRTSEQLIKNTNLRVYRWGISCRRIALGLLDIYLYGKDWTTDWSCPC